MLSKGKGAGGSRDTTASPKGPMDLFLGGSPLEGLAGMPLLLGVVVSNGRTVFERLFYISSETAILHLYFPLLMTCKSCRGEYQDFFSSYCLFIMLLDYLLFSLMFLFSVSILFSHFLFFYLVIFSLFVH